MNRRRDIMRWGGALTAFVYLFGWMLAFGHNVTEQHVVCAEHGDLVHAGHGEHGDHSHNAAADIVASINDAADGALPSMDDLPRHEDHEHCSIGPFLRNEDEVVLGSVDLTVPFAGGVGFAEPKAFAESPRPPPVSILSLAPKTSPPVHA